MYAEDNLVPEFNVRDNIRLPLQFQRERGDGSLEKLTEELKLTGMLTMRPQSLSEEQQLRAAIAMALIRRPRIVFADDITAHLHTDEAAAIHAAVMKKVQAGDLDAIRLYRETMAQAGSGNEVTIVDDI